MRAISGASPDVFLIEAGMCEAALTAGAPPAVSARLLPKKLRQVECLAAVTVEFQSEGGGVWTRAMQPGDVQLGYVVCVRGVVTGTELLGYV